MSACKHGQPLASNCQLCAREREHGETVTGGEDSQKKAKEAGD